MRWAFEFPYLQTTERVGACRVFGLHFTAGMWTIRVKETNDTIYNVVVCTTFIHCLHICTKVKTALDVSCSYQTGHCIDASNLFIRMHADD